MSLSKTAKKYPSLRSRAANLMNTKLPGTLQAAKPFPKRAPYANKTCVLNQHIFA